MNRIGRNAAVSSEPYQQQLIRFGDKPPVNAIVLATTNEHKARELSRLLRDQSMLSVCLADFPHVTPIVEDGRSLAENACKKAVGYAQQLARWVLADDTGLEVDVLKGAPGVRSARYAGDQATMAENRDKLLDDLSAFPESQWSARYVCHLAIANPAGELVAQTAGRCLGRICREPAGESGFGYDVLFEVEGYGKRMAELTDEELAIIGHRACALQSLAESPQFVAKKESLPFIAAR